MAGPTAPFIAAATVVGACAALMLNNNRKNTSSSSSSTTGLKLVDHSGSSGTGGIPVRPVAYRHVHSDAISAPYGEETKWARKGLAAGAWKYV
ncbi:hypothetical protein HDU88_001692 [Geranomyces variabilis]|nr:hypothetical protein HDU88_001692 [Geranomyces variabilis]